jgi:phosphoribosylformylglycinamidine cyclo-ligase
MTDRYADAGVNVSEADKGIEAIIRNIKSTWPPEGPGSTHLPIGYFANVIDIGVPGLGLAVTTDGVGSKTIIADLMGRYDTIGIDCVAMNVNDLICVGAKPISLLDYIGVDVADPRMLEQISVGLAKGARTAGVSISGGEVSQLPDTLKGFDLVGSAFGLVSLNAINTGEDVEPGDVIIGIASSGIHSNGLTLARRVLFGDADLDIHQNYGLDHSLGDELLVPTEIYVNEVLELQDCFPVKAMVNVTGDGLLNLNRIRADGVGFCLDMLPKVPEIFNLIEKYGLVDAATMFQTFNMGVGFCVIVDPRYAADVCSIVGKYGKQAFMIGDVVPDEYKSVVIPPSKLVGRGKRFESI